MKKLIKLILFVTIVSTGWYFYTEIFTSSAQDTDNVKFSIESGESVAALADKLEEEGVVRSSWLFQKFVALKGIDRDIRQGTFTVEGPVTLSRVVTALANPSVQERTITIIPGWSIRDIAQYFVEKDIAQSEEEVYEVIGLPVYHYQASGSYAPQPFDGIRVLEDKSDYFNLEGYLSPDTFRIFKDATITDIVYKLVEHRDQQMTEQMYTDIERSGRSVYDIITMASIIEREVRGEEDKKIVSDLFWRRYDMNWALQADSSVHYLTGKSGDVFTTKEDRESLSPWNTYKYPGLPLGPISNPSLESIMAAIYPESNEYWYFLTDLDGMVHYATDLEGHNSNVAKYLR